MSAIGLLLLVITLPATHGAHSSTPARVTLRGLRTTESRRARFGFPRYACAAKMPAA